MRKCTRRSAASRNRPKHFPVIDGEVRRAVVDRFPYGVFFVELDDEISVIGIMHLHRDPQEWRSR
jgi:toxin ParE1/3/4